jgi:hypothetical protein
MSTLSYVVGDFLWKKEPLVALTRKACEIDMMIGQGGFYSNSTLFDRICLNEDGHIWYKNSSNGESVRVSYAGNGNTIIIEDKYRPIAFVDYSSPFWYASGLEPTDPLSNETSFRNYIIANTTQNLSFAKPNSRYIISGEKLGEMRDAIYHYLCYPDPFRITDIPAVIKEAPDKIVQRLIEEEQNLRPENIKSGVDILGIEGTYKGEDMPEALDVLYDWSVSTSSEG